MTDYDALNAAILDDPHAVTPRTVLADWLADHGGTVPCPACALDKPPGIPGGLAYVRMGPDSRWASCTTCSGSGVVSDGLRERAEFIRVQVELARRFPAYVIDGVTELGCGGGPEFLSDTSKRFNELRRRERELWTTHGGEWFRSLNSIGFITSTETNTRDSRLAVVSHGFVSEVRLSLAAFVGGDCGRCRVPGSGVNRDNHPAPIECPACKGTGRVPGLARELFAAHPITRVVLTDLRADEIGDAACWVRHREGITEVDALLPDAVFDLLEGGRKENGGEEWLERFGYDDEWCIYPTRDAALTALSDACVAYGRAAVGLRPLTAPTPATH